MLCILRRLFPIIAVMTLFSAPAVAQANGLSVRAIVDALQPERAGPVTRSLKQSGATRGITIEGPLPQEIDLPHVDVMVNFEFDSARLTTDTFITLRMIGEALKHPSLENTRIQLAGHTSAEGTEAYNMALSQRRASEVMDHLVAFYEVDPSRIAAVGYGESQLLYPQMPNSELNRRVRIVNIDPLVN